MNNRRVMILTATALALGAAILMIVYMRQIQDAGAAAGPPTVVFVASQDVPARATISLEMIGEAKRPSTEVEPDFVKDPKEIVGKLALITMPKGATFTTSKLGNPNEGLKVPPGMRAVSISIDKVKGVSGLIQPGDHVDVIAVPRTNNTSRAATILRGILVLAIGNTIETASGTPPPQFANMETVTLSLTPRQADLIAAADIQTTLRLSLRSPNESLRSLPTETLESLMATPEPTGAPAQPQSNSSYRGPVTALTPRPTPPVVIIDGDKMVQGGSQDQRR
jgi:pilus assembly protein CpaB